MDQRTYSDAELLDAAAASFCMRDFLDRLGVEITPGRRRHLCARLDKAHADLSHWDRSPSRWYTREQLAAAVESSISYAGVLRALGIPLAGGSQAYLARRIRREGLDTSHSSARLMGVARATLAASLRTRCSSPWLPARNDAADRCCAGPCSR